MFSRAVFYDLFFVSYIGAWGYSAKTFCQILWQGIEHWPCLYVLLLFTAWVSYVFCVLCSVTVLQIGAGWRAGLAVLRVRHFHIFGGLDLVANVAPGFSCGEKRTQRLVLRVMLSRSFIPPLKTTLESTRIAICSRKNNLHTLFLGFHVSHWTSQCSLAQHQRGCRTACAMASGMKFWGFYWNNFLQKQAQSSPCTMLSQSSCFTRPCSSKGFLDRWQHCRALSCQQMCMHRVSFFMDSALTLQTLHWKG